MAKKLSVAEQVSQLTQEQQDKIVKMGKIGLVLELVVGIPWAILMLLGLWTLIDPPLGFNYSHYDAFILGYRGAFVIGALCIIGILAFVKIKCPYYSDAKYRYIKKMRKGK